MSGSPNRIAVIPSVRLKMAEAYHRVGVLHERLGQAEQERTAYQQALAVSSKLATDFPDEPYYRQLLARSYCSLGYMLADFLVSERRSEIEQAYAEALRIQEELLREEPANLEYQHDLGSTYFLLGYLHLFQAAGPPAEAEEPMRRAVDIRQKLVAAKPTELSYRTELGMSLGNLGNLLTKTHKYDEAEAVVRQELEVRQKLVDDFPTEYSARLFLGDAYMDLALLRSSTGQFEEAVAAFRQEREIRKRMAAECPQTRCLIDLRRAWRLQPFTWGDALGKIGAQDEALAAYQEAIADCKDIIRLHPESAGAYALFRHAPLPIARASGKTRWPH